MVTPRGISVNKSREERGRGEREAEGETQQGRREGKKSVFVRQSHRMGENGKRVEGNKIKSWDEEEEEGTVRKEGNVTSRLLLLLLLLHPTSFLFRAYPRCDEIWIYRVGKEIYSLDVLYPKT